MSKNIKIGDIVKVKNLENSPKMVISNYGRTNWLCRWFVNDVLHEVWWHPSLLELVTSSEEKKDKVDDNRLYSY